MSEPLNQLSVVVFSWKNTGVSVRRTLETIRGQKGIAVQLYVVDLNDPADIYALSLRDDLKEQPDVELVSAGAATIGQLRNQLLGRITTPYVVFANMGEQWEPDKGLTQIRELEDHPEEQPERAVCLCGYTCRHPGKGPRMNSILPPEKLSAEALLLMPEEISPAAFLYRCDALRAIGGFSESMKGHLDIECCIRLYEGGYLCAGTCRKLFRMMEEPAMIAPKDIYLSSKTLYYQYYDYFLRRRSLFFPYQLLLAAQAAACNEWAYMAVHGAVALCRTPLLALRRGITVLWKIVARQLWTQTYRLRLYCSRARLRCRFRQLCRPEPRRGCTAKPTTAALEENAQLLYPVRPFGFAFRKTPAQVVLPDDLTEIPEGLFAGCKGLVSVVIPASVQRIREGAFFGCTDLCRVEFQRDSNLTAIEAYAFSDCISLQKLELPGTVSHLGAYAFAGCAGLQGFLFYNGGDLEETFPPMISRLPEGIFAGCENLCQIIFPENSFLNSIEDAAFLGCGQLYRVQFTSLVETVGDFAFAQCDSFTELVMPRIDGIKQLGRGCFLNCRSLESFRIPYALTRIQPYCFYGCSQLRYVKLNRKLQIISSKAFSHCPQLESVKISDKLRRAEDAFDPGIHLRRE